MCGRGACTLRPRRCCHVAGAKTFKGIERYRAKCNLTPQSWVPVIIQDHSAKREVHAMRWGLVPSYAKAEEEFSRMSTFNARVESVASSGLWRRLIDQKRCVVIFDGFYEWKVGKGDKKTPVFVRNFPSCKESTIPLEKSLVAESDFCLTNDDTDEGAFGSGLEAGVMPLLFAGLYDVWVSPESGEPLSTVTILTMDPMGTPMEPIHDRMPIFLTEVSAPLWLASGVHSFDKCKDVVLREARSSAKQRLQIYEVSNIVGSIRNETPDCLRPREDVEKQKFDQGLGRFFVRKKQKVSGADVEDKSESKVVTGDVASGKDSLRSDIDSKTASFNEHVVDLT